jgi:hypothetical protein
MFVGIFSVIAVIGVITVDFGLWLSERRGSQTDADLPALAGARECMLQLATGTPHDPYPAIVQWFNDNNGGNATLEYASPTCEEDAQGRLCVTVRVRHDSETLFSSFFSPVFDAVSDNIGAHATACAGAANAPEQITPFETDNNSAPCFNADETPNFTTLCGLEFGAQGGPNDPNPRGIVDLEAPDDYCSSSPGSGDIEELIEFGAEGICLIDETPGSCAEGSHGPWYECASTQTGNPQKVLDGTAARIAREPLCDGSDANNIDDFDESVEMIVDTGDPATSVYQARDCDPDTEGEQISPRVMTIIVFDEYPTDNNTGYSIVAFAGFYLAGCAVDDDGAETGAQCNNNLDDDNDGKINDGCSKQGGVAETGGQCDNALDDDNDGKVNDGCPVKITEADLDPKCQQNSGGVGHVVVFGKFVRLVTSGGGIGSVDPSSTMFGIALTE